MKISYLTLLALVAVPICNYAWATSDLSTLGSPNVSISSNSGSPGTNITITVSHIPDISKTSYPYPDLYIYLPFSQPFGVTVSSHCGGQDCFPIYTHDDSLNHDFADRIITFSLPSTSNPKPVFLNGFENTVCDVTINGKTAERFSTLCNAKDEPKGLYQVKIGWVLETDLDQKYTTNTIPFLVNAGAPEQTSSVADNGDTILKEYQNGTISQAQFYAKLKARGWTDEEIRQALAVIGKLPHQMGIAGPDDKLSINQTNSSASTVNNTARVDTTHEMSQRTVKPVPDTNKTEHIVRENSSLPAPQNSSLLKPASNNSTQPQPVQDPMWNSILIGLTATSVAIMVGVIMFVKTQRGRKDAR